ncbi:hypothetical protein QBC47DRAFT_368701 [Echria macrotheca]|uniref:Uncharacterized protein n=1 Tax=Echria macrotheca TaxID=438768 RepID=A0AAJ0BN02_9PEZI|nr:hypothetical protein QBC47DRAFT_368701 [Echria macrotheca]
MGDPIAGPFTGAAVGFGVNMLTEWVRDAKRAPEKWDRTKEAYKQSTQLLLDLERGVREHPNDYKPQEAFDAGRHYGRVEHALDTMEKRTEIHRRHRPVGCVNGFTFNKKEMQWATEDLLAENKSAKDALERHHRNAEQRMRDIPPVHRHQHNRRQRRIGEDRGSHVETSGYLDDFGSLNDSGYSDCADSGYYGVEGSGYLDYEDPGYSNSLASGSFNY